MIGATETGIKASLAAHGELRCDGNQVSFVDPAAQSLSVNLRVKEPHQLVHLARALATIGREENHFAGAYLWITTWGVWNRYEEAIGFKSLEAIRRSLGEDRAIQAAPGHVFRHDEFVESISCLLPAMTVGWDAYYVPRWAYGSLDYFLFVSHDFFIDVHVRTKEMREEVGQLLASHKWITELTRY